MTRYSAKRRLVRPLIPWRRRRVARAGPFNEAVFEAHDYSRAMLRFADVARADPYLLVDADLPAGGVALDVGAYTGLWTGRLLERVDASGVTDLREPDVCVHSFEPVRDAIAQLRAQLGGDPRVVVHEFGLGGRDRKEAMSVGGPGSSLYVDPSAPNMFGTERVEIRDVAVVLDEQEIERIDLIKINIEGGEYELIDRLYQTGWLRRTGPLIVQFHEFAPDAHRARRRNRRQLAETHRCTWSYPWVYERWDPI
jgi:FkbM family methyltransferase